MSTRFSSKLDAELFRGEIAKLLISDYERWKAGRQPKWDLEDSKIKELRNNHLCRNYDLVRVEVMMLEKQCIDNRDAEKKSKHRELRERRIAAEREYTFNE